MKRLITLIVSLALIISSAVSLSACGAIRGNGNGCNVTACSNPPAPCNYDILTGKCK